MSLHIERFYAELMGKDLTAEQIWKEVQRQFPDPEQQEQYWDYGRQKAIEYINRGPRDIDHVEFSRIIDTQRLSSENVFATLIEQMEDSEINLPFGTDSTRRYLYRLISDPFALHPHPAEIRTTATVLPACFLGINVDVCPTGSPRSTVSAESDDADNNGWVFFQLGYLEILDTKAEPDTHNTMGYRLDEDDLWDETGFCVVARMNTQGYTQGIYIVADVFPEIPGKNERDHVTGDNWGRQLQPHSDQQRFFCAYIGKRLGDIKVGTELAWKDKIMDEVELVRTKRAGHCQTDIIRVTVSGHGASSSGRK